VARPSTVVFDLDGTLIDSDEALVVPFLALGVPREEISFGHPIEVECTRLGLSVADYVAAYDPDVTVPFDGVEDLLGRLPSWSVCSNKAAASARAELARLGWAPEVALFADDFGGRAKELVPVLAALGVEPPDVLFVGDTPHDAECARVAGTGFAWAGWNPRTAASCHEGTVLGRPVDVLGLLDLG
jgi:HAD superfamily hydrolase (TIGR01549 family)